MSVLLLQAAARDLRELANEVVRRGHSEAQIAREEELCGRARLLDDLARDGAGPRDELAEVKAHLAHVTDVHHKTIRPGVMHAPHARPWSDCPALTCQRSAELLDAAAVNNGETP